MKLTTQKRLASELLKVGQSRIWISPENEEEISKAITRHDVLGLIQRNVIQAKPKKGVSRVRAKTLHAQRKKGRRKGYGKRKGSAGARMPQKEAWMNKVRPLRRFLKLLKDKNVVDSKEYRGLYNRIKGNFFRNVSHLKTHVEKMKRT
ncbi:MAG TPA: 50S ribosomal protein L19e [Candidatus Woesearchaeota archaeon]|nr:50S ribosomal protein L19e [Candidatus Woesearchaeota archaeon]